MTVVDSPLPEGDREIAGAVLRATLVGLLDLFLVAQQAHRNLYGPRFRSVHAQLDEAATIARDYADTVAQRSAAPGASPDGRAVTIAGTSGVPAFPSGPTEDDDAVGALVRTLSAVIGRVRERVGETGPVDDVSQDLLIGLTAEPEKRSWMFQAGNRA